ncbi:citrate lyase holo-[acyl-carrier protein] synthase [Bradyrhizobium sp. RDM12]
MRAQVRTVNAAEVGLEEMLAAREQRATRQAAALARFGKPLVSMTMVMPGPVKGGPLPRRVLELAVQEMEAACRARGWRILSRKALWQKTGPEALSVIDADAVSLKLAMIELEDHHPLGRLWDLDVIAPGQAQLSRQSLGESPRRCLACGRPARVCGRSRRHPLGQLLTTIGRIVHEYDLRAVT